MIHVNSSEPVSGKMTSITMARPAESDEGGKAKSKFVMIVMSESMLPAAFLDSAIEGVVGE